MEKIASDKIRILSGNGNIEINPKDIRKVSGIGVISNIRVQEASDKPAKNILVYSKYNHITSYLADNFDIHAQNKSKLADGTVDYDY